MKNKYDCFGDEIESYLGKENRNNDTYFLKPEYNENDLTKEELDEYIRKKSPLKLMTDEGYIRFIKENRDMVARSAHLVGEGTVFWEIVKNRYTDRIIKELEDKAEAKK